MQPPGAESRAIAGDPWHRIAPAHSWRELIIPESQLKSLTAITAELSADREHRRDSAARGSGSLLLFSGPIGTGKTMAARVIGAELGMPVLEVDTTALRARDRARLEQLLRRVFATARDENAILFFEHADAVLGERPASGVHARPGVLTAPDLFEYTERHPSLVIFSSTLRGKIDPAYRSRFRSVIEFPFPDAEARERIWHQNLPEHSTLSAGDVVHLGRSFQLPGAAIAACCAAAQETAHRRGEPVRLLDVAQAVEAEYSGRLASDSTLSAVAALVAQARGAGRESEPPAGDEAPTRESAGAGANGAAHEQRPAPLAGHNGSYAPAASQENVSRASWQQLGPVATPERRLSAGRRLGYALLVAAAILGAAAIGYAAARLIGGTSAARATQAKAGPISVSLPPGWRPARATGPALGLTNELTLRTGGTSQASFTIGMLPPGGSSLLPAALLSAVHSAPPAQIMTLRGNSFYHYPNLVTLPDGSKESVYATPTTAGTLVGVCTAPPSAAGATGQCERILSGLRLASGQILGTAAGVSYARALDAVLTKLDAVRASSGKSLAAARTAAAQAVAAGQVAAADAGAALAVSKLNGGPAARLNSQLAVALRSSAAAYGALASAARRHDAAAYAGARASVTSADASITTALTRLSALGYRIG